MTEKQTNMTVTFTDPICGMQVMPATAAGSLNQDGETFYFCSAGCLQKFIDPSDKEPSGCCSGK